MKGIAVLLFSAVTAGLFAECANRPADGGKDETPALARVRALTSPGDGLRALLSTTESLSFVWEEADSDAEVSYEIVFVGTGGDFSEPLYAVASDGDGADTHITLPNGVLDNMAAMTGAGRGEEAALHWSVKTTRNGAAALSEHSRGIILVRAPAAAVKPRLVEGERLYIDGEGAEAGQEFKKISTGRNGGVYEIYTRLTAGGSCHFYSEPSGVRRTFSLTEDLKSFTETAGGTVAVDGMAGSGCYRITLDFEKTEVDIEKIEQVAIRPSWTQSDTPLAYAGRGVWKIEEYNIALAATAWGFDERYKFVFTVDGVEEHWGQSGPEFGQRPDIDREGYRDMAPTQAGQWNGAQFKFPAQLCDRDALNRYTTDIVVSMTAGGNYTHDFENHYSTGDYTARYTNPVFEGFSLPDPDVIRAADGFFYLYATEHSLSDPDMKNAPIMRSSDLVEWERVGSIFTDATHPRITGGNAGIWAPSINIVDGKYVVYYSQPGDNYKHAIGVASSDSPAGPFTDHGKIIDSNEQGVDISIDAYLYQEDGRNYLFWGSFREISVIELTADGLALKPGEVRRKLAGGQYEAVVIEKRNGYYYMIVSTGNYSKGGTYSLVAGRSQNITGPYIDKAGEDMIHVKHEPVLEGNDLFSSPGHCSRIITDAAGQDWILYHSYPTDKDFRCLMLDPLDWVDGWPVVNSTGYPSYSGYREPVFD